MIPLMKRRLPSWQQIQPYISKSEALGQYTNFGFLHKELQDYLGSRYGGSYADVALTSSATLALSLCIKYYQQQSNHSSNFTVIMPSWTFAATGHSALFVGTRIEFIDTAENGIISPEHVKNLLDSQKITRADLILPVIPFGRMYDPKVWEIFSLNTNIPVVLDCAAGFSSATLSHIPTVVSTHATKYFPTAEGGFVLCKNQELISSIKCLSNFGFQGSRSSSLLGTNAKLSEYHAAIGLAYKDLLLQASNEQYKQQVKKYFKLLKLTPFTPFANSIDNPVSTFNIKLPKISSPSHIRDLTSRMVSDHGIETRRWWQAPLHKQLAFKKCGICEDLINTDILACSVVALPLGEHIADSDIHYIVDSLMNSYTDSLASPKLNSTSEQHHEKSPLA